MENNSDKDLGTVLEKLKAELILYVDKRMKWGKLFMQERSARIVSAFIFGMLVTVTISVFLFFSLIGLALWIGRMLDDPFLGFLVMVIFSFVVLLILLIFRKKIQNFLINKAVVSVRRLEHDGDEIGDDSEI